MFQVLPESKHKKLRYSNNREWTSFRVTIVLFTQHICETYRHVTMLRCYVEFATLPTVSFHNTCLLILMDITSEKFSELLPSTPFIHRIFSSFCGLTVSFLQNFSRANSLSSPHAHNGNFIKDSNMSREHSHSFKAHQCLETQTNVTSETMKKKLYNLIWIQAAYYIIRFIMIFLCQTSKPKPSTRNWTCSHKYTLLAQEIITSNRCYCSTKQRLNYIWIYFNNL
jgi:hypothetical protein